MANLNISKRIPWELPAAIAIFAIIYFYFPHLMWIFIFIQIFLIIAGVIYYKFVWRCPHCKLANPTLKILIDSSQKLCDDCTKKRVPGY